MRERGFFALLPVAGGDEAAVGEDGHIANVALGGRRLHSELALLAQIRQDQGGAVAGEAAVVAAGERRKKVAPLVRWEVPQQFEGGCVKHAVHIVRALDGRRAHPMPPSARAGGPRRADEVRLESLERQCPLLDELGVTVELPLEIVAPLGIVGVDPAGHVAAGFLLVVGDTVGAVALHPAAEAVEVIAVQVKPLGYLDLRSDEEVAVGRVPAAEDHAVRYLVGGKRLLTRRIENLPVGMLRLDPRRHVHPNDLSENLDAFGVRGVYVGAELLDVCVRQGLARADIDDFVVLAKNVGTACKAHAAGVGAAADRVGPVLDHLIQITAKSAEAEALVGLQPGVVLGIEALHRVGTGLDLGQDCTVGLGRSGPVSVRGQHHTAAEYRYQTHSCHCMPQFSIRKPPWSG